MRKYLFSTIIFCLCAISACAQKTGDQYADLFNEHLEAGLRSEITMSAELPLYAHNTDMYTLTDTLTGEPSGYIYQGYVITDAAQVDSAILILNEGIKQHRNRLDLYFGLAATYLFIDQPDPMIETVERAMKQEKKNKGIWLWTADEQLSDTIDYMYERVQEDFSRFWAAEDLERTERLANIAVKYYPTRAEYWNNMGAVTMWKEESSKKPNYQKALKYFQEALKLKPDDELIQANIEYLKGIQN